MGPQTLSKLQSDEKFESEHIKESAQRVKTCIRYVPQFNVFLYASESMSSPQGGQVHMMVMPKCNEPSPAAKAAAEAKKKEAEANQPTEGKPAQKKNS